MNGFTWLNDLMTWLARWVPRLTLIKAGNVGAVFSRKGRVESREAGLVFWWPITQDLKIVSTRIRTTELAMQLHGWESVSLVLRYQIEAPRTMLLAIDDVFSMMDDRTQAHLGAAYEAGIAASTLCARVLEAMQIEFSVYGVNVLSVDIAQRGFTLPIKLLNDWGQHSVSTLEGGQSEQKAT